jgi:hypothetical protein
MKADWKVAQLVVVWVEQTVGSTAVLRVEWTAA